MAYTGWSTSNFVRCPSGIITAAPLTIAAWVKIAATGSNQDIAGCYTSGSAGNRNRFCLQIASTANINAQAGDATATSAANSSTTITTGTWAHAAAVFTSDSSRAAFLNGGGKGTSTTAITPSGINRTSIAVGDGSAAINNMGATDSVAEVGFWNAALDDAEIAALAAGIPPLLVRPQSLIAYVPLVRNLIDYKGNAFALVGTPTAGADHCRIYGAAA